MKKNKYARLISDMIIFIFGTVLTKVVQFILMPLYTTYMTTEAYGIAELTNNMSEFLMPIITLCIYEAAFRYAVDSKFTKKEVYSSSLKVLILTSIIGTVILIVYDLIFKYEYSFYLYIILIFYSLQKLNSFFVRGKGYSKIFALSGVINAIILTIFNVIFLVKLDLGVKGYLLSIGLSYFISSIYLFVFGKIYKDIDFRENTKLITRELLDYCTPLIIYNIGYWLTTMSGRYILLWNTNASMAGTYAAVIKIAAVINMLQQAFYSAFQLNTSREFESDDKEEYFSNIYNLYSSVILIFGSIILCCSPILAKLTLKGDFFVASKYLPLILFVAIIDCLFCFFKTMYTTYKYTKRSVPSMIIGAIINIVIALLTVKKIGIWGVCIASLLCYLSQAIYRIIDTKKFVNIKCNWKIISIMLVLLFIQVILLSIGNLYNFIASITISIIIIILNILIYFKTYKNMIVKLLTKLNFFNETV